MDRAALVVDPVSGQAVIDSERGKETAEKISLLSRM